nr:enolase C-terminal domain-like protein [Ruegeria lacuscaerulensis]
MVVVSEITITKLKICPVLVPLRRPVVVMTGQVTMAPLVLIDLERSDGSVGRSYLFTYSPIALKATAALLRDLAPVVEGTPAEPRGLHTRLLGQFKLLGTEGVTLMAIAGIDMAAWDAVGQSIGRPLYQVLGGAAKALSAYNSNGMGLIGPGRVAGEARDLLAEGGFSALKVRLGYPDVDTDLAVLDEVRTAVGEATTIVTDYNQGLSVAEAKQRLTVLAGKKLGWIEEPIAFDNYDGLAELRAVSTIPIQGGENHWGPGDMARATSAGALDLVMIDAMKIGGVTGWLEASSLARAAGWPVSSHLFPEVSTHLMCADPGAHWLEWVDWANPILKDPYEVVNGKVTPPDRPGMGLEWDEGKVAQYAIG